MFYATFNRWRRKPGRGSPQALPVPAGVSPLHYHLPLGYQFYELGGAGAAAQDFRLSV
jgi:hypothetical protein